MKEFAKGTTGIAVVVVLVIVWYMVTVQLRPEATIEWAPASQCAEEFDAIVDEIARDASPDEMAFGPITDYDFVTVTVSFHNNSLFSAELATMGVNCEAGSILVREAACGPVDIPGGDDGRFRIRFLTRSDAIPHTGWLEYYILGKSYSVPWTFEISS